MQYDRRRSQLLLGTFVVCLLFGTDSALGQSAADAQLETCKPPSHRVGDLCCVGNLCLGLTAFEIAQEVCYPPHPCVSDLIKDLGDMGKSARCDAQATRALILRQEINEMVLTASLQVDGFLAEIDSETAEIRAVHDRLSNQRDTKVSNSTLGSAIGTGGGAVGSALALAGNTASTVGSWIGATFGGVGALYGFLGYFQAHGSTGCFPDVRENPKDKDVCPKLNDKKDPVQCPKPGDEKDVVQSSEETPPNGPQDPCKPKSALQPPPSGCSPTMLYHLICPEAKKIGYYSEYDPAIDAYLKGVPPNKQMRRGETLIQSWRDEATDLEDKEKKEKKEKLAKEVKTDPNAILKSEEPFLFNSNTNPRKLSIDDLTSRANKLADLRTVVSRMNRDLSRLTEDLAKELWCPAVSRIPAESTETRERSPVTIMKGVE